MDQNSSETVIVDLTIALVAQTALIEGLTLTALETQVRASKPYCEIRIPVGHISSTGKNKNTLILFLSDPQRIYEDEEEPTSNKMDELLFKMLNQASSASPFLNVLKGGFVLQLRFANEAQLSGVRSKIQTGIALAEEKLAACSPANILESSEMERQQMEEQWEQM